MFPFASKNVLRLAASSVGIISYQLISKRNNECVIAQRNIDTDYTKEIESARNYIETERLIQGVPGITVAVMKDNKLIWSEGFGYIDIENRILATPASLMRIASISKALTSTGIGLLLQQNKLDLNNTIQHYLPNYPLLPYKMDNDETDKSNDDKNDKENDMKLSDELCSITIEQLCNHQSGIRHYKDDEFLSTKRYETSIETLEIFKNDALEFKPGTKWLYSTYNFCVLSAIIEQITNMKFIHFMENEIFNKLKMYDTFYETNNNILMNRSKQYIRKKDKNDLLIQKDYNDIAIHKRARMRLYNTPYVNNSNKFAGGGFLSTSIDIAKFGNYIVFSDVLLNDNIKQKLFLDVDNEYNYGLGWNVYRNKNNINNEIIEISHSGRAVGGCSHLLILPKDKIVVAILMNMEGGNPYISRQIARYFQK